MVSRNARHEGLGEGPNDGRRVRNPEVLRRLMRDRGVGLVHTHSSVDSWLATLAAKSLEVTEVGEAGSFSILRGPLAGLTGILVEVRRSQRLILSVNLLRRSVLVEVHPDWVSPYAPAAAERLMA